MWWGSAVPALLPPPPAIIQVCVCDPEGNRVPWVTCTAHFSRSNPIFLLLFIKDVFPGRGGQWPEDIIISHLNIFIIIILFIPTD